MSPSSTGDSPPSVAGSVARHFPLPARDNFTIEVPNATLTAIPNGTAVNHLKSPSDLKSQRTASFSQNGILGATQKNRNLSQSTADSVHNGMSKAPSDEGSNPLKRRNTDVGVDYPRRRATIAVGLFADTCQGIHALP